jgi:hypothetical protein
MRQRCDRFAIVSAPRRRPATVLTGSNPRPDLLRTMLP